MAERWSPLVGHAPRLRSLDAQTAGRLVVSEEAWSYLSIRGAPSPSELASVRDVVGVSLPVAHDAVETSTRGRALRLGPDEWLVAGPAGLGPRFEQDLLERTGLTAVDLSAARVTIVLRGEGARSVISGACSLDLEDRAFVSGRCAQTLFARIPVIIEPVAPMPGYRITLRPSLARYVADWLLDAATDWAEGPGRLGPRAPDR